MESFPRDEQSRFLAPSASLPGVTVLNKNQIIVAATVHMVDDQVHYDIYAAYQARAQN